MPRGEHPDFHPCPVTIAYAQNVFVDVRFGCADRKSVPAARNGAR